MHSVGARKLAVSKVVMVAIGAAVIVVGGIGAYLTLLTPAGPREPIRLAFINGFTGAFSSCANESWLGAQLAVEEVNAKGGVKGRQLELVKLDDQSNPQQAVANARLADQQQNALALTGICQSDNALALRGYAEENKMPVVVSVAAATDTTKPGTKYTFRVDPDTVQLGASLGKFIVDRKPDAKLAIIISDLAFSREVAAGLRWFLQTSGKGTTVVYDQRFPVTQADFTTAVAAIKVANPDIIFMGLFGPGPGNFYKKALEAGFRPDQFVSSLEISLFIVPLGPPGAGTFAGAYFSESLVDLFPGIKSFIEKIKAKLADCAVCGKSVSHSEYSTYLSILLAVEAMKKADPLNRETFVKGLREITLKDDLGRTLRFDENGALLTGYYFVQISKVTPPTWESKYLRYIEFPKGSLPVHEIVKSA